MVVGELLRTAVYPTVLSAVIAFVGAGFLGKTSRLKDIWMALALAASFAIGFLSIVGKVPLPPVQVTHWLLWLAIFGWLCFSILGHLPSWITRLVSLILFSLVAFLLLKPFFNRWSSIQEWSWILGLGLVFWLLYLARVSVAADEKASVPLWIFIVAATGASLIHVMDGGAMSGQLGGVLAAGCGGLFLASLMSKDLNPGPVTTGTFVTLFSALLILGHFYVEVSPIASVLVGLSIATFWTNRLPVLPQKSTVKRFAIVVGLTALPVAIALIILVSKASNDSYGGY